MTEVVAAVSLVASVIAIIQVADRVISLSKYYLNAVDNAPSDIRIILIETFSIKATLQSLEALLSCKAGSSMSLDNLFVAGGPIEGCRRAIDELKDLLPPNTTSNRGKRPKHKKFQAVLTALAWPSKESKAKRLLKEISEYKTSINLALTTESTLDIKYIKSKTTEIYENLEDNKKHEVYKWLQLTDPSLIHNRACSQYEKGTGDWIQRSQDWVDWLECKNRCLWIHGIPGAGKTVLVSRIIEILKKQAEVSDMKKTGFAYYYCYYGHKQDEAAPFLRWIINQLCRQAHLIPACLFESYKAGAHPTLTELLQSLERILKAFDTAYIVIDAIDESIPRDDLIKVVRDLATDPRFQNIRLLVTSREYLDIEIVMEKVSIAISMLNPLLEEDIGRFRWASCQLDALQRLKGDSLVIKKALACLPKTLDETYERIFLNISDEDRMFVRGFFEWIHYENELYCSCVLCPSVLEAIKRSIVNSNPSAQDIHYDENVLRDICGCLITVIPNSSEFKTYSTVSFAHYTVWEFLESDRILKSGASCFAMRREKVALDCTKTLLQHTVSSHLNELTERKEGHDPSPDILNQSFEAYALVSSILSLSKWSEEISEQEDLFHIAIDLLDPTASNHKSLQNALMTLETTYHIYFEDFVVPTETYYWKTNWIKTPKNSKISVLYNLLLIDPTCKLAAKLLESLSLKDFINEPLHISCFVDDKPGWGARSEYSFDCNIIEIFSQLSLQNPAALQFLLEQAVDYIDSTRVLVLLISSHHHVWYGSCENDCVLNRVLQIGADVNGSQSWVTPLQIAVARLDLGGVELLLEAGADPNGIGGNTADKWKDASPIGRFNQFRGMSPLRICINGIFDEPRFHFYLNRDTDELLHMIKARLLRQGANDFFGDTETRCNDKG